MDVLGSYWTLAGDVDPLVDEGWSPWDFEDRVRTAAEVGFTGIGIWHDDLFHLLEERSLADLREILDAHDIEHVELEFVNDWFLDPDDERRRDDVEVRDALFEAAEVLDAHHVKMGNLPGTPCDDETLESAFADLVAEAETYGATLAYEIVPSDPNVRDVDDALALVEGHDEAGVLLDTWHMGKLGIDNERIARIPPEQLVGVELNDGFREFDADYSTETTQHRQLPGDGDFDVRGFVDAVRAAGFDGPWGVEVLNAELRTRPMKELYRTVYDATARYLR